MTSVPDNCLYTKDHEWLRVEGDLAATGITAHAAEQLGEVTFVELPDRDEEITQGGVLGTVESVKAVSEIFAPAGGIVKDVNDRLAHEPELINSDPYGEGWICRIALTDRAETGKLLTPAAYKGLIEDHQ
jgi:glycine cleavage system H protein